MLSGPWRMATIPSGGNASNEVDLGGYFDKLLVLMSDLTTDVSAVLQVSDIPGGTFTPLQSGGSDVALPKSKATVVTIGGAVIMKITCTTAQGASRDIRVKGFSP